MFEQGYYLCKKDVDSQEINEFINSVFSSNAKRQSSRLRVADVGEVCSFTAGRLYYSLGGADSQRQQWSFDDIQQILYRWVWLQIREGRG